MLFLVDDDIIDDIGVSEWWYNGLFKVIHALGIFSFK